MRSGRVRSGETWLKTKTAGAFYSVMQRVGHVRIPRDTGDFRLMSRRVVDAVLSLREQHRFMKGAVRLGRLPEQGRALRSRPRGTPGPVPGANWRLWNLALEGVTSFTVVPLRVATYAGLVVALLAMIYGLFILTYALLFGSDVAGYPSLMTVILFMGGVQLVTLGVIGEYLGRVFNETKQRPLYIVERFDAPSR